jgi:ABC-type glycerol-3-phosphate transport system substrate-binding protein
MIKRIAKSRLTAPLIAVVLFLAACAQSPDTIDSVAPLPPPSETPSVTLEYKPDYIALPDGCNMITDIRVDGGDVYFIAHFTDGDGIYTMKSDGTELATLTEYAPTEGTRIAAMSTDGGGSIWIAENNTYAGNVRETGASGKIYIIRRLEKTGAELSRVDLIDRLEISAATGTGTTAQSAYLEIDQEGNIWLCDASSLHIFDAEGREYFSYKSNAEYHIDSLAKTSDGAVYAVAYSPDALRRGEGFVRRFLTPDVEGGGFINAAASLTEAVWYFSAGGGEYDLYYASPRDAGAFSVSDGAVKKLIDWAEYGLSDRITAFGTLPDGAILAGARRDTDIVWNTEPKASMFAGDSMAELVLLTPGDPEIGVGAPGGERTAIHVASFGPFAFQRLADEFNRTNTEYEILVTEYDTGIDLNTFELDADAVAKFNAEIVSKQPPDIIISSGSVSADDYIDKGVFEDLYPFIDADLSLGGRGAFIPSILSAYETEGALYRLPVNFGVMTVAAPKTVTGGAASWTVDELTELASRLPPGSSSLPGKTAGEMLEFLLRRNIDAFIDRRTGECSFDGAEFIKLLEYAGTFPIELRESERTTGGALIREGHALADTVTLNGFYMHKAVKEAYGGDITYIGYPCALGSGSSFISTYTVSISAVGGRSAAAWQFARMLYTEDFQSGKWSAFSYFPVNQASFDDLALISSEKSMLTDENGRETEALKAEVYIDMREIDVYALTSEEIEEVRGLIASIDNVSDINYTVLAIIQEEAQPFFAGQKSVAEAAALIQSRAAIYVNERR